MKMERFLLVVMLVLGTAGPAAAGSPADPGKGPPDCPGTPGAFISAKAQQIEASGTAPGQVVKQIAQGPDGPGVGTTVRGALADDCGIGALPQPADPNH